MTRSAGSLPASLRTRCALALLAVALGGCASIPLSTMFKLSSLEPRRLAQLDPADVRVRLSVSEGYEVDIDRTRLALTVTRTDEAPRKADMPLDLVWRKAGERPGGFFGSDVPVTTYELSLSPEGARELRELQPLLLAEESGEFTFKVSAPFSRTPAEREEVTFWADLKLSLDDAYFPLIDGARVQFDEPAGTG